MPNEKLTAILSELELELSSLRNVDEQQRRVLEDRVAALRSALSEDEHSEVQSRSLVEELSDAVSSFEGHHPTLSAIIGRLADGLAQMGI